MWTEIRGEGERRSAKVTEGRRGGGKSEVSHHAEHKRFSFILVEMSHGGLMYDAVFDGFHSVICRMKFALKRVRSRPVKATFGEMSLKLQR